MRGFQPGSGTNSFLIHALFLAIALEAGCAPQAYEGRTAKVSGKVTLGDAAVSAGNVLFMMEDGHAASTVLGTDGTYSTECRPGTYKVAVTPPELVDPLAASGNSQARVSIPNRYQDLGTSGLTIDLKEGDNRFDIPLKK